MPSLQVRVPHSEESGPGQSVTLVQGLMPPVPVLVVAAPPVPVLISPPALLLVLVDVDPGPVADVDPPDPRSEES